MSRELWPHQAHAIDALRDALRSGSKRVVCQLPTGAGKTITAAAIFRMSLAKGKRVMFTVPAISLIDQTARAFWDEGIRDIGVMQADHPMTNPNMPVQIASVQTLARRQIPSADLVIVDEVHRMSKFMTDWMGQTEWAHVPFIGLSATPWSKGLGRLYDRLIIGSTMSELMDAGVLCRFRAFAPSKPDLSKVRTVAGDYHEGDLAQVMGDKTLTADIVSTWLEKGEGRPTLVFGVDRAHARQLAAEFEKAGVGCGYIDANTPADERDKVRKQLECGAIQVVCNIGCLTTGVDWDIRCIVLARPTKSEMLYCLDMETEILTSHGWRGMGSVAVGDCAATMADLESGAGSWSRVVGVVDRAMDTGEEWVGYDAPRANFRVTDRHTMLVRGDDGSCFKRPARALIGEKGGVKMPTAVHMNQIGVPLTDAELYFIGMMMADGTWTATSGAISQSERHPEILRRIEECLRTLGIGYSKRRVASPAPGEMIERNPRWLFSFSNGKPKAHGNTNRGPVATKRFAEAVPGTTGFHYLVPYMDKDFSPALMAMSQVQLDHFLAGLWDGDGSKKLNVDYTPRSMEICSSRQLVVDRLQALCAINGYTANVRKEHGPSRANPIWMITITPKDWRSCGGYASKNRNPRPAIEASAPTAERVWCVQTETGTIITRRRGKVTVTGNCQIIGRGLRTAQGKDHLIILDHTGTTSNLGFITDIHHDRLNNGTMNEAGSAQKERETPKPTECSSCKFLKPAGVSQCPNCGFKPAVQSTVTTVAGELVELDGKRKAKAKREPTMDEKIAFMASLKAYQTETGKSDGYIAHKFKAKMGVWPNHPAIKYATPAGEVAPAVRSWIRSQNIRYAKSMEAKLA